jgi:hypothetical protein
LLKTNKNVLKFEINNKENKSLQNKIFCSIKNRNKKNKNKKI